jgi:mono/diheme cytochrome c family protein
MAHLPHLHTTPPPTRSGPPSGLALAAATFVALLVVLGLGAPGSATATGSDATTDEPAPTGETTEEPADPEADAAAAAEAELIREGEQVYSQICSACHQPGGTGLAGQYPPLLGNPNVDDAAYVAETINNGKQGELVVLGETYNGVMPSFSTLTDDEVAAITAYIQNDFEAPAADEQAFAESGGPVAGTELPALTNMSSYVAYLLAALVILLVLTPRLLSANDRLSTPWLDAWLKTASIVLAVYLLVIYIPNWALQREEVAGLSRFAQDLVGTGLWGLGVLALLGGLWYAHRESRL